MVPVSLGLAVLGATAYGFLIVSARALGPERYAPLSALWALVFLVGPGIFVPLEQEMARAVSARDAQGLGSSDLVRRAAWAGGAVVAGVCVAAGAGWRWLVPRLFDAEPLLLVGLVLSVAGYYAEHLVRGILAGTGRFRPYGLILGTEGSLRLVGCVVLAVAGVSSPGPYGLVLGAAPALATLVGGRGQQLSPPGPVPEADAGPSLTNALGWLLAASLLAQVLVNGAPVVVKALASPDEAAVVGRFMAALIVARVPLFLFSAVQAAALPRFSRMVAAGRHGEFRAGLMRLVAVISAFAAVGSVAIALAGPTLLPALFGRDFTLERSHVAYLAAAMSLYMLAMTVAQALIAVRAQARVAGAWLVGCAGFALVAATSSGLLERAERGLLAGSALALVAMAAALVPSLRLPEEPMPVDLQTEGTNPAVP